MRIRCLFVCGILILLANVASAARYQRCRDGKTLVWNSQRGVAQEATWSGVRDVKGYATGEGTLTWWRLNDVVNTYTGKMMQGKFEGTVVKDQDGTRLQAKFANGEKVGAWSEPGSEGDRTTPPTPTATATVIAKATATAKPTEPPVVPSPPPPSTEFEILPTPIPFRSPARAASPRSTSTPTMTPVPTPIATPTPTPTPAPTRTPTATQTPSPMPTEVATPTPRSTSTLSPAPTSTPPILKSIVTSPTPQSNGNSSRLEEIVEGQASGSLAWQSRSPSPRDALEEEPFAAPSVSGGAAPITESKSEIVAQFKKQTESLLNQMRDATEKFREVDRIDSLSELPSSISTGVETLTEQARDIRFKFGYEVAMYECGAETATVDALGTVVAATRDLTQKNAPVGRVKLMNFFKRYPASPTDKQKPLWRYTASMLMTCNKVKKQAEDHLQRAKAFEASGNKADALGEYKEIYRLYPNAVTADKIKLLEEPPR